MPMNGGMGEQAGEGTAFLLSSEAAPGLSFVRSSGF